MSLFSRILDAFAGIPASSPAPRSTEPDMIEKVFNDPPKSEVALSCFVLGLVKSIETETDQWKDEFDAWGRNAINWTHSSGMVISIYYEYATEGPFRRILRGAGCKAPSLSMAEATVLQEAFDKFVIQPRVAKQKLIDEAGEKAEEEKAALLKSRFEKLGCPK